MNADKILGSYIECAEMLKERNDRGIERYRKGSFKLKFNTGTAKTVKIRQTRHKFLFGCTAFMLGSFEVPEKETEFKRLFSRLFNQAVVPFYWRDLEPREGELRFSKDSVNIYRRPAPDICLEFCREYGIEPKGHCLIWNSALPGWLEKKDEAARRAAVERRFAQIAERYSASIPSFDIVNESATNYRYGAESIFPDYDRYCLSLGGKYFKKNRKILNETNGAIWCDYPAKGKYMSFNMQLAEFLREGLPIDEIGLQYHIFESQDSLESETARDRFLNARYMTEILDIYNSYGLPMHISEITVPSCTGRIAENEDIQARLTEALYTTWFATENMKSIVWWNLVDGYAAYAPLGSEGGENMYGGGLCRFDMTPKPSYDVLDRLINREWHTEFSAECGREIDFRGFYGDYEITVCDGGKEKTLSVSLNEDGKTAEIQI